ncbi:C4-dicarboxylate ABC transporter [Cohnella luojiensis]|uniref:C4-dicarboxylate ABC transporter n=2 Tax=Cohnella luojiensis TaxID=652876 RepID=A0A4Y8LQ73_9BACL|nr:C4-dicarboxylate ABC transporter [Cohnella luojiensis]
MWMAWIGIAAGIIAFFAAPLFFGCVAVVLGLITVFSKANILGWWAIGLGIVGAVANWWFY